MRELWIKRLAHSSTVVIVKTSDPRRLDPFIKFLAYSYDRLVDRRKISSYDMYLYRVWSGLFKVSVYGGEVRYEPVSMRVQPTSIPMLQQTHQQIRDLISALTFIDNLMNQKDGIVFMLWGLFPKKGAPQEQDALIAFLRNAIFTGSYYGRYHTVLLFTDTPEVLIDDDTLKHCILVDIPPSFDIERRRIIEDVINTFNLPKDNIEALVEATKGLTLHETESVIYESFFKYRRLDAKVITSYKYDIVRKSGILDIEEPKYGFEAIGGYDVIKEFIIKRVIIPLRYTEFARRLAIRPPRGILMFGPPGTGKTLFARVLARELGIPFLRLRTEKIVSKWYGESLAPNEKVVIYDAKENKLIITEISKFYNMFEPYRYYAVGYDNNFRVAFLPITNVIKHASRKRWLKIRTKLGREIVVTDDHSLFTIVKDSIIPVKASELKIGDRILVAGKIHVDSNYSKVGLSTDEAVLLGLFIAEGTVHIDRKVVKGKTYTYRRFRITINDKEVRNWLKQTFGLNVNSNLDYIDIPMHIARKLKLEEAIEWEKTVGKRQKGRYSRAKKIPDDILLANDNILKALLKGIFSGDGWISKVGNNAVHIGIITTSETLFYQLLFMLHRLGYIPRVRKRINRCGNTEYVIELFYKWQVEKFIKEIGFIQKEKLDKALKLLKEIKFTRDVTIPIDILDKNHLEVIAHEWLNVDSVNVSVLIRNGYKPRNDIEKALMNRNIILDEIVEIKGEREYNESYDLEVPPTENFATAMLILAHNTSRNIAKAIEIAEAVAPCVMFIDEIDRFGRRGHLTEHEESRRAFSILLEWLGDERRKTIVIGTTNRPEDLDEAFRRVGRFDYMIPFLYPDLDARVEILKVHTSVVRKIPLSRDVNLYEIAKRTDLWSGAELEELVVYSAALAGWKYIEKYIGSANVNELIELLRTGKLDAIVRTILEKEDIVVTSEHFREALKKLRRNVSERREQLEKYMKLAEEFTNDAEFLESLKKKHMSRLEALKDIIEG